MPSSACKKKGLTVAGSVRGSQETTNEKLDEAVTELVRYIERPDWLSCFFFNNTAPPEIYPLSLHDALPISDVHLRAARRHRQHRRRPGRRAVDDVVGRSEEHTSERQSRPHLVCRLLLA